MTFVQKICTFNIDEIDYWSIEKLNKIKKYNFWPLNNFDVLPCPCDNRQLRKNRESLRLQKNQLK